MEILPLEIIEIILLEFSDDIEYKILFKKPKKIELQKYDFIKNIVKDNIKSFSLYHKKENEYFSFRYINIGNRKYYRVTYKYNKIGKDYEIKIETVNNLIPMYYDLFI